MLLAMHSETMMLATYTFIDSTKKHSVFHFIAAHTYEYETCGILTMCDRGVREFYINVGFAQGNSCGLTQSTVYDYGVISVMTVNLKG